MSTVITMTGPGTATVNLDPVALAITTQGALTVKQLTAIHASLNEINKSVLNMKNNAGVTAKAVSDLQIAVASIATATASQTVIQAAQASNQIKTNNFQVQATKDALTRTGQELPVLPTADDQIKTTIQDSIVMNTAAVTQGAVTNYIVSSAASIQTWIVQTEVYKSIADYLKKAKDAVLASILPKTPEDAASIATSTAGVPKP